MSKRPKKIKERFSIRALQKNMHSIDGTLKGLILVLILILILNPVILGRRPLHQAVEYDRIGNANLIPKPHPSPNPSPNSSPDLLLLLIP